ncbi:hypothetical protein BWQ96_06013 [Gracilariopsis chorda]|uniref:Uncharacterized protein n=1 Tax=Gracilariopsis chorda TaxID=448386 RepID=A0A2V3IQ67_9FLOR|nr:hypothetical protein BWQ96_06013 [Gracilariopsis chorda]|eukprot:PXF44232.1 hypothetical protein BWQ96_06013 [Gracilariopsis chorda]
MPLSDMEEICGLAHVPTPFFRQALQSVVDKDTTCRTTGRPASSRKVALRRLLVPFNDYFQIYFTLIPEMENISIIHTVDLAIAFSVTATLDSRELEEVCTEFELFWGNGQGPPTSLSGDPELANGVFKSIMFV